MTEKLNFAIENAEIVSENPNSNFALLSLDFFASGDNLHDLYVSEETLLKTAPTIKNCPIVWKYDEVLDDVYTHDPDEVPCGFVPENSTIKTRLLDDGRTMLSVVAYVWKRYTGELLNIFKRDGYKKPVSVEIRLKQTGKRRNGKLEILDFVYEGITILGSFVTPAIPLASATVLSFSQEYEKAVKEEFTDSEEIITFPYKSIGDINPALKGISPPLTLGQANEIARQADAIGVDGKANGWAIAISSFKKTHVVKDGRWVKKSKAEMEMSMEKEKELKENEEVLTPQPEAFAEVEVEIKKEDDEEEEEKEEKEEEMAKDEVKEEMAEEEKKEEKKFGFPKDFTPETFESWFAEDEEEDAKMAKEEVTKGEFADPEKVMNALFAKISRMMEKMAKMEEEKKAYMEENSKLKGFKAGMEESQKAFEVEKTLSELSAKVIIPDEVREEMLAKAQEYTLENIEGWIQYCKAKSFEFAVKDDSKDKDTVVRVGMPFGSIKKSDDIWSSK